MRISDWSSDVCSSDLDTSQPHGAAQAREQTQLHLRQSDHRGCRHHAIVTGQREFKTAAEREAVDRHDHRNLKRLDSQQRVVRSHVERNQIICCQQIGRAPCRERVCTYVEISVDASTSKKKTEKTE